MSKKHGTAGVDLHLIDDKSGQRYGVVHRNKGCPCVGGELCCSKQRFRVIRVGEAIKHEGGLAIRKVHVLPA